MGKIVRIGTRESRLAVIQTQIVADAIKRYHPEIEIMLVKMKTTGDKILDKTLDKMGGKGLFVKELDEALKRGDVDICVHSYKDMPAGDDPELPVVAVSPRADPRDVLILPREAESLSPEKPVGSSGKRRQIQFKKLYPNQAVAPVRGNVLTRLEKLDSGEFSALILAAAGIKRLGLWARVSRVFEPREMLPAGCQGILAVQGRRGEDYGYLSAYNDKEAWVASIAERAYIKRLGCGCGAPAGVFCEGNGEELRIRGMFSEDDENMRFGEITGSRKDAAKLGAALAEKVMSGGGTL